MIVQKLKRLWRLIRPFGTLRRLIRKQQRSLDEIKIAHGLILSELFRGKSARSLQDYEFKVFSQSGEDGIIQHLVSHIPIQHKTFIEFGIEDYLESNTRFLMVKDNWRGFVLDGSQENIKRLKKAYFFYMFDLKARQAFITRDNIKDLLAESGFEKDLGLLSVDLDGVDYWILSEITNFSPRILVVEYNAVFGCERSISVPYDERFFRTKKHATNLYFGASLPALASLAKSKGYALVGTNKAGINAFFVRKDLLCDSVREMSVGEAFTMSHVRESLDETGEFSFLHGEDRLEAIRGMPVINTLTGKTEAL